MTPQEKADFIMCDFTNTLWEAGDVISKPMIKRIILKDC
jgi:hypothetical protein